jgi:hypothetical protein
MLIEYLSAAVTEITADDADVFFAVCDAEFIRGQDSVPSHMIPR